jgi:DEAD/DEAH box helicase domain-containing protein
MCIFDTTAGSLRLTQRLAERFPDVVAAAAALALPDDQPNVRAELTELAELVGTLRPEAISEKWSGQASPDLNWVEVIAPGQRAMLRSGSEAGEVEVIAYRYTPQGLMYELVPRQPGVKWMVAANQVEPVYGETAMVPVNLTTGETDSTAAVAPGAAFCGRNLLLRGRKRHDNSRDVLGRRKT